jgi:hypothetical protein
MCVGATAGHQQPGMQPINPNSCSQRWPQRPLQKHVSRRFFRTCQSGSGNAFCRRWEGGFYRTCLKKPEQLKTIRSNSQGGFYRRWEGGFYRTCQRGSVEPRKQGSIEPGWVFWFGLLYRVPLQCQWGVGKLGRNRIWVRRQLYIPRS